MHIKSRPARQSGFFVLLPSLCQTPLWRNPRIRIYLCRSAGLSTPLPVLRLERQVSSWGRRTGGSREADASTAKRGPQRRRLRLEVERPRSSAFLRNTAWEGTAQFFLYLHQKPTKMTKSAFLFDLDGVILDTEGHYTEFWDGIGADYLGDPHLAAKLKGETIATSLMRCFPDDEQKREEVRARLYEFEANMKYEYVPGAHEFLTSLKAGGYPTAIVTSSNRDKMAQVYKSRPEIRENRRHAPEALHVARRLHRTGIPFPRHGNRSQLHEVGVPAAAGTVGGTPCGRRRREFHSASGIQIRMEESPRFCHKALGIAVKRPGESGRSPSK